MDAQRAPGRDDDALIVALDTDVLVTWAMAGDPRHPRARKYVETTVKDKGRRLALVPQVLWEFVHVTTDVRRFEKPMSMDEALAQIRQLWDSTDVVRVLPSVNVVHKVIEFMHTLHLGRKRILDTALAATLIEGNVKRLVTWNVRDFLQYPSLEAVEPD